ncbi:MAG: UvrB/UvrC motif-containing protein [Tissierellales bacterium]|nr:UvrB/UvrC motif-containing protein [Tissierellales bacterium]
MICESCKKRDAKIHYKTVINGVVEEHHLCEICAAGYKEDLINKFPLHKLFGSIYSTPDVKCKNCGLSYEKFRSTGKLGCSECYDAFGDDLKNIIKGIHGHTKHTGKMPKRAYPLLLIEKDINRLISELDTAVKNEEYEKAALLRDEIKELKNKLELADRSDNNDQMD